MRPTTSEQLLHSEQCAWDPSILNVHTPLKAKLVSVKGSAYIRLEG